MASLPFFIHTGTGTPRKSMKLPVHRFSRWQKDGRVVDMAEEENGPLLKPEMDVRLYKKSPNLE